MPGAHRNQAPQVIANGDIYPNRFVTIDPTSPPGGTGSTGQNPGGDCQVVSAGATAWPIGISAPPGKWPATNPFGQLGSGSGFAGGTGLPDVAAQAGEEVEIFGLGDICWLQVAVPVVPGNFLAPTGTGATAGRGTTAGATGIYGAVALEKGSTDQLVRVQILIGSR